MSLPLRANYDAPGCRLHTEGRGQLVRQRTNLAISQGGDDCAPGTALTLRTLHGDVVRILVYPTLGVQMGYMQSLTRLEDHG